MDIDVAKIYVHWLLTRVRRASLGWRSVTTWEVEGDCATLLATADAVIVMEAQTLRACGLRVPQNDGQ